MTIYNINLVNIKTGNTDTLTTSERKTKSVLVNTLYGYGPAICNALPTFEEFAWNLADRVIYFMDAKGKKVGFLKYDAS